MQYRFLTSAGYRMGSRLLIIQGHSKRETKTPKITTKVIPCPPTAQASPDRTQRALWCPHDFSAGLGDARYPKADTQVSHPGRTKKAVGVSIAPAEVMELG